MSIFLRRANQGDEEATFRWVNDPLIRKFSHNTERVSRDAHNHWFTKTIQSDNCAYYLLESEQREPIGSIRFDLKGSQAKINYLIDPCYHGQGLGLTLLKMGVENLKNEHPEIIEVFGQVYEDNLASIKIFEKLNYNVHKREANLLTFASRL
ncbi:MAG: GNAT family N-acetyltransferase [Bacteroidota bacterium]